MNRIVSRVVARGAALALAAGMLWAAPALALDNVTLQLKWTHCFQFAGYYAAQELGYYREAGLDVRFEEGKPGVDVVGRVVSGDAQYGVGSSSLLLARAAGKPVVALAVIFQHSPLVLIARAESGTQSIHDLVGKRVMIEPEADEIAAYLKREGLAPDRLVRVAHSFDIQGLIDGRVDALTAYVSNEPEILDRLGFPYRIYTPRSAGIDFYADNLFTSERELNEHSKRVRAFRAASLRGWQYAMAHPEQMVDLILKKYRGADTREHYLFEAKQIASLMHPELIEVGYMNPGRWRHMADVYAEVGLLPSGFSLDGFLYDPNPDSDLGWAYTMLASALGLALLVVAVATYVYRINRRLARSVDELQRTQSRLQVLSMAVEQSPTSVIITGPDSSILYVNPYFTDETGYSRSEIMGKNPRVLSSGLTAKEVFQEMWTRLSRGEPWTGELVNRRKSGEVFWEEARIAPVKDDKGNITHYVAVKLDITARRDAYRRLAYLAHHDPLTELPNRTLFFERLGQQMALSRRTGTRLALMFVDLDRFKPINDAWGHAVGDGVLQEAARRMRHCLRDSDTVGRIGGDEFVILLSDIETDAQATSVAEQIRRLLGEPFRVADRSLSMGCSIGVAIFPEDGNDEIELARNADRAMYRAKENGRDQVVLFSPAGIDKDVAAGEIVKKPSRAAPSARSRAVSDETYPGDRRGANEHATP